MKNRAVTAKQIQHLDQRAIKKLGIPSVVLMENAGRAVAQEILKDRAKKVCIVCGIGNNGGDGFVIARHLSNAGIPTRIFLIGKANQLKLAAATNYQILKNCRYQIPEIASVTPTFKRTIAENEIIVDAIFGVGLNRGIREPYRNIIQTLNQSKKRIIAVDVPSGLDATTGKIHGVCVKAYKTVTFSFPKKGFFKNEGPLYIGKLVVVDIGIPKECYGGK